MAANDADDNNVPDFIVPGAQVLAQWSDNLFYEARIIRLNVDERKAFVAWPGWPDSWECYISFSDLMMYDEEIAEQCYNARLNVEVDGLEEKRTNKKDKKYRPSTKRPRLDEPEASSMRTRRYIGTRDPNTIVLCSIHDVLLYKVLFVRPNKKPNDDAAAEVVDNIRSVVEVVREIAVAIDRHCDLYGLSLDDYRREKKSSLETLATRYNAAIRELLMKASKKRLEEIKVMINADISHVRAVRMCNISVNRIVPNPDVLNRYAAFSPLTYGEVSLEQMHLMLIDLNVGEEDTFIDLGSGVGRLVLYVAAMSKVRMSIGIELASTPAADAEKILVEFNRLLSWHGKKARPIMLHRGNFLDDQYREVVCEKSTIVFVNNYAFGPALNELLKNTLVRNMKDGTRIVTTLPLISDRNNNFSSTASNIDDIDAILDMTEMRTVWQPVPSTSSSFFLHTVNRAKATVPPKKNPLTADAFYLISTLGRGAFGKVILAGSIHLKRFFALKCSKKREIIKRGGVEYLQGERRILELATQAGHPFLVKLLGCTLTPHDVVFVMEYAPGGDLRSHFIHSHKFDENRACFYAACVLLGLEFLHHNDIMHRDLKLDNLLLDAEGYVKIADFGLCKPGMGPQDHTSTFCGTRDYLAPEVLIARSYTRSIDWWALGVLLFEMLTGDLPFSGKEDHPMFHDVLMFPRFISNQAVTLLQKLLRKNPLRRLGHGTDDYQELKNQTFWNRINWNFEGLMKRSIKPPFKPELTSEWDYSNFNVAFTREFPRLGSISDFWQPLPHNVDEQFKDFNWQYEAPYYARAVDDRSNNLYNYYLSHRDGRRGSVQQDAGNSSLQ